MMSSNAVTQAATSSIAVTQAATSSSSVPQAAMVTPDVNNSPHEFKYWTRTIAHYQRHEQIGEGTYGQVYRATCLDTNETVALKKMRLVSQKSYVYGMPPQLIREIKILKKLHHPNLLRLIEVVTSKGVEHLDSDDPVTTGDPKTRNNVDDPDTIKREKYKGNLFLVLEYVTHDLTGLMDVAYQFTEVQIKSIFQQLLSALAYMHKNKYVHRDIKSSNILLDHNFRLKLADFGLARSLEPPLLDKLENRNSMQDLTNKVITLWYRAPEILLGTVHYGCAVDIWSAGCILAELMTGKPLATGKTELEQLKALAELTGTPDESTWEYLYSLKKSKQLDGSIPAISDEWRFSPPKQSRLRKRYSKKNIPDTALNLLEKMLDWDPRKRMTCANALQHRYFWTQPVPPADPAELGTIQVGAHFHEFQTKQKRRSAKAVAEQEKEKAILDGLNSEEAEQVFNDVYRGIMKQVAEEGFKEEPEAPVEPTNNKTTERTPKEEQMPKDDPRVREARRHDDDDDEDRRRTSRTEDRRRSRRSSDEEDDRRRHHKKRRSDRKPGEEDHKDRKRVQEEDRNGEDEQKDRESEAALVENSERSVKRDDEPSKSKEHHRDDTLEENGSRDEDEVPREGGSPAEGGKSKKRQSDSKKEKKKKRKRKDKRDETRRRRHDDHFDGNREARERGRSDRYRDERHRDDFDRQRNDFDRHGPQPPGQYGPDRRDRDWGPPPLDRPPMDRPPPMDDRYGPPRDRPPPMDDRYGPPRDRPPPIDDRYGPPRDRPTPMDDRYGPKRDRPPPMDDRSGPGPPRGDFRGPDVPSRRDRHPDGPDGPPRRDRHPGGPDGPPRRDRHPDGPDGPPRRDRHPDGPDGPPRRDRHPNGPDGPLRRDRNPDGPDGPPRRDRHPDGPNRRFPDEGEWRDHGRRDERRADGGRRHR